MTWLSSACHLTVAFSLRALWLPLLFSPPNQFGRREEEEERGEKGEGREKEKERRPPSYYSPARDMDPKTPHCEIQVAV